jgi:C-terminal processing protease CtpA/Prc
MKTKQGGKFRLTAVMTAVVALSALFTVSCEIMPPTSETKALNLSATSTTVGFTDTGASLTVVASKEWLLSVIEGKEWLKTDTKGGTTGTTTVRFNFTENEGERARTGRVQLWAVGEDDPYEWKITQNSVKVLTGVNKWIFEQMSGWYYWNEEIKASAAVPENGVAYDRFLHDLIDGLPWASVQDTSDGESVPTIDGAYKLDRYGNLARPLARDHIYSNIERTTAGTRAARAASESVASTFGFDAEPINIVDNNNQSLGYYYLLVTLIRPDGPAEKAGLKRGMWITKYNDAQITPTSYETFWYQLHHMEGGTQMTLTDEDKVIHAMKAEEMTASPIYYPTEKTENKVITSPGGKKVAYLFYNGFERGDETGSGSDKWEFDEQLRKVFGEFKAAGAEELVLDLRYNPGGYVESCRILTRLAGAVDGNMIFAKLKRNAGIQTWLREEYGWRVDNPEIVKFYDNGEAKEPNNLGLNRVYVLAARETASASEMVINALRGVLGKEAVVHIGETTNGKNVGMDQLKPQDDRGNDTAIDGYDYTMWPITFKALNAVDFTDYAGGFTPTYKVDEFTDALQRDGVLYDLGDPRERLLKAALTLIDGGTVTPDTRATRAPVTRADGTIMQPITRPTDPRRGGAKYIPPKRDRTTE